MSDFEYCDGEPAQLGPCCACGETGPHVRNMICYPLKSPIAGRGWGCTECGLPSDGAMIVLCDACLEARREPVNACAGYPERDGRVPFEELAGRHFHNLALHLEVDPPARVCRVCGCSETQPCYNVHTREGCHWIADDLCSACCVTEDSLDQDQDHARTT